MTKMNMFMASAIILGFLVVSAVLINQSDISKTEAPKQQLTSDVVDEKLYIALEGDGKIVALDTSNRDIISTIDLSDASKSKVIKYMAHNVQVAPNGKSVWVTANAMSEDAMKSGHGEQGGKDAPSDQVIIIDPLTDRIIKRIPLAEDSHAAHVVLSPNSKMAYITLQEKGALYTINAETFEIVDKIDLGENSGPHGIRISQDGTRAFVAFVEGKTFAVVDTETNKIQKYPLGSAVVQTATTRDGDYVLMSLYSTKKVGRFDTHTKTIDTIDLPKDAKGPVQLYATPNSRFLYVADQGYYFDQSAGDKVYRVDIRQGVVDQTITTGKGPHGVVVDAQGRFVYITNLLSDDISVVDTQMNKEIARIPVGDMPNGISIWHRLNGGTP